MALPKAMRLLALATLGLFCFLVYQIFKAPSSLHIPALGTGQVEDMLRDPNLDGMRNVAMEAEALADIVQRHWGTSRTIMASQRQELRPRQRRLGPHQCYDPIPCP